MKTESVTYDPASFAAPCEASVTSAAFPFVPTESRTVGGDPTTAEAAPAVVTTLIESGEIISTQSITSKTRTVETVTVKFRF